MNRWKNHRLLTIHQDWFESLKHEHTDVVIQARNLVEYTFYQSQDNITDMASQIPDVILGFVLLVLTLFVLIMIFMVLKRALWVAGAALRKALYAALFVVFFANILAMGAVVLRS